MIEHRFFGKTAFLLFIVAAFAFQAGCQGNTTTAVRLPPTKLSSTDLRFGEEQVGRMMRDRSKMRIYVGQGDIIYTWMARQYGGEKVGQHIYWSKEKPDCGSCVSSYSVTTDTNIHVIHVAEEHQIGTGEIEEMPSELSWRCAVYEMYNITHAKLLRSYLISAIQGKLSKKDWIESCLRLEFDAMQQSKKFYTEIWRPCARSKGLETDASYWFMDEIDDYDVWRKEPESTDFFLNYYSRYYDEEIASRLEY